MDLRDLLAADHPAADRRGEVARRLRDHRLLTAQRGDRRAAAGRRGRSRADRRAARQDADRAANATRRADGRERGSGPSGFAVVSAPRPARVRLPRVRRAAQDRALGGRPGAQAATRARGGATGPRRDPARPSRDSPRRGRWPPSDWTSSGPAGARVRSRVPRISACSSGHRPRARDRWGARNRLLRSSRSATSPPG